MWHLVQCFWSNEKGQDLTEYALLMAFVVLAATGFFMVSATSLSTIWIVANGVVNQAAIQAHASS